MQRASLLIAAALGTVLPATGAHAQIVDYATLGEVFGEPVTTSVTGKPQRVSEVPASITIITAEQIARSPARSVPDLLRAYAGVDVNRWTAGQSDVAVRGGVQTYNPRLLVLVDGRQVYLDHYGMTNWNLLGVQMEEIQQIELVRGPASALFGFNAASGVVNIVTKGAGASPTLQATAEAGTHGYSRIGAVLTMPLASGIGLKISGGSQREDERSIPSALYQPPVTDDVRAAQLNARLSIKAGGATTVELNGGVNDNRQLEFLPSQLLTEQRFRNQTIGIVANHDTNWGSVTGRAYSNWLQADYGITTAAEDPYSAIAGIRVRNRIFVGMASTLVRLGNRDTLRFSAEYRNNQMTGERLFSRRIGYEVFSASGMLDIAPTEHIAIIGAARLDHLILGQDGQPAAPQIDPISSYHRTITPVSFNAAVTVQVSEAGSIRVNGGRGLQLPSLVNFGLHVEVPAPTVPIPVYFTGDPRLDPVTVWSGEASYSHRFHSSLRLDATLFYTRTKNVIASPGSSVNVTFALTPDPVAVTRFANVGRFDSYGIELGASASITSRLNWSAKYSLMRVDENFPANRDANYYAVFPRTTTPRHRANLNLDYVLGGWAASATAHLSTVTHQASFLPTTDLTLIRVPTSVGIDARISRAVTPRLSLYGACENLGNGRGVYGSPIPADRRIRLGVSGKL